MLNTIFGHIEAQIMKNHNYCYGYTKKNARDLLVRYRNTLRLMDATYRTTNLPLFFVCSHKYTKYMVVVEFIVQSESAESILEAINIIKQ